MTFSGQILKTDSRLPISGVIIKLVFTGFTSNGNDHYKITTDNNGGYAWEVTMPVGEGYAVQAVYDGSSKNKSSKSQTEYFDVRLASLQPQPQPPTQSSGVAGMEWIMILIPVIIIVVVVVAIKSRKKTSRTIPQRKTFGVKQPKKRRTGSPSSVPPSGESASTFAHYECPNCHSENVVQNPNGSELCSVCGWRS
jgi:hypothetical protein